MLRLCNIEASDVDLERSNPAEELVGDPDSGRSRLTIDRTRDNIGFDCGEAGDGTIVDDRVCAGEEGSPLAGRELLADKGETTS